MQPYIGAGRPYILSLVLAQVMQAITVLECSSKQTATHELRILLRILVPHIFTVCDSNSFTEILRKFVRMHEQCVPYYFSSKKWPGYEANSLYIPAFLMVNCL